MPVRDATEGLHARTTLDNIWPQCGPKNVALAKRYFKQKDLVENFLADKVKTEVTDPRQLANLQKLIAGVVP